MVWAAISRSDNKGEVEGLTDGVHLVHKEFGYLIVLTPAMAFRFVYWEEFPVFHFALQSLAFFASVTGRGYHISFPNWQYTSTPCPSRGLLFSSTDRIHLTISAVEGKSSHVLQLINKTHKPNSNSIFRHSIFFRDLTVIIP